VRGQAIARRLATTAPVNVRSASLRAVYIIWYRDVLRFARDRIRLLVSFAQPLLYLLIFGTGLSSTLGRGAGGFGAPGLKYQQFIFPGVIGMSVLFTSFIAGMSIVWDREFGFLKEVLVAPINRASVAVGKTLGSATQAMFQGLVILALAPVVGVHLTVVTVLQMIPLTFLLAFALSAVGVALGARMRSLQGFQMVMNFLMLPMFFLSGALFPLQRLPAWLAVLTRLDPAAYGVDPLRRAALGSVGDRLALTVFGQALAVWTEQAVLIGFGLLMLTFAVRSFGRRD